jgi:hypothetical protein
MDAQLKALPTLPVRARTVSGCVNSANLNISQHFTVHLFRPWILSSARGIDGGPRGPRRFTEVVLNEEPLPVAYALRGHRSEVVELLEIQRRQRGRLLGVLG